MKLFCFACFGFLMTFAQNDLVTEELPQDPMAAYLVLYEDSKDDYKTKPEENLPLAQLAYEYACEAGDPKAIANTSFLLGKINLLLQDYAEAYKMFSVAKQRYGEIENEIFVGWCYNNLGVIETAAHHFDRAGEFHALAITV